MTVTKTNTLNTEAYRIGYGEDAHRLVAGRDLVIAGVTIPEAARGAQAHSDGDVAFHALADALLSTFGLADIGHYFPPSDDKWKNLNSCTIVMHVWQLLQEHCQTHHNGSCQLCNIALVITLDKPKLGIYRQAMQASIAEVLGLEPDAVGLTFKTSEGLALDHVQARATLLVTF